MRDELLFPKPERKKQTKKAPTLYWSHVFIFLSKPPVLLSHIHPTPHPSCPCRRDTETTYNAPLKGRGQAGSQHQSGEKETYTSATLGDNTHPTLFKWITCSATIGGCRRLASFWGNERLRKWPPAAAFTSQYLLSLSPLIKRCTG